MKNWKKFVGGEWIVKEKSTNRLRRELLNVGRYLWYFLFPLQIVALRHEYDKIIGWQQFYALNYVFLSLVCSKKVNDVTVMTFIYRRKRGLIGKLYHRYMNYIVTSKYVDRFIFLLKKNVNTILMCSMWRSGNLYLFLWAAKRQKPN